MSKKIVIRNAVLEELDLIADIYGKAVEKMNHTGIFQWDDIYPDREILQKDILNKHMFVGEIEGRIASVFVLNQECDEEYRDGAWQYRKASFYILHRLCVNPDFQGKGVGAATMELIEGILQKKGIETIRLDAFSLNPIALAMYHKLGYKKVGEVNWRKGLFYLFEKKIV